MINISEVMDQAKNVANTFVEIYNLQDGSPTASARITIFKRKIIS